MNIMGIDLSLTSTGLVVLNHTAEILCARAIKTKKLRGMERLQFVKDEILKELDHYQPDFVVIEGYSYGSRGNSIFEIGELGGVVRLYLYARNVPYVIVPPTTLKKWVTGKGNSDKSKVMSSILNRFQENFSSNDIADAYGLARMGLELGRMGLENLTKQR